MEEGEKKQQILDWCCAVLRQTITCANLARIDYRPKQAIAVWEDGRKQIIDITGLNEFETMKKVITNLQV